MELAYLPLKILVLIDLILKFLFNLFDLFGQSFHLTFKGLFGFSFQSHFFLNSQLVFHYVIELMLVLMVEFSVDF